jgi:hypothetical protein
LLGLKGSIPGGRKARTEVTEFAETERGLLAIDQSVEPGFKLSGTKIKKTAEPQALSLKPSVHSVNTVRVFLLPGKHRNPPRDVGAQDAGWMELDHISAVLE